MKNVLLALIIAMTPLPGVAAGAAGGGDRPLLMAGKHSLYQRVLSVPGARIADKPGARASTATSWRAASNRPAFTIAVSTPGPSK